MNKRGISHIEAILSFVLFVGFLAFAFYFFNPFNSNRTLDSSLTYAFNEIKDNSSIDLEEYSVVIKPEVTDDVVGILIDTDIQNAKARVEDNKGNNLSFRYVNQVVYFERLGNNFTIVKFSEDFPDGGLVGGTLLNENNYTISSSSVKKIFSEKRIKLINSSYASDYNGLKRNFNLPNRVDFGFRVNFDNGDSIIAGREVPEGLEVISNEKRIEIIRVTGEKVFADLIVRVW